MQLNGQYRNYLSYIMSAHYQDAEILKTSHLTFANFETEIPYSGFNMGGGEHCVAHLLYLMDRLPNYGLLVIEEIESCLHPQAQVRLAKVLVKICNQKKLQVICSTHSETFLDSLPRDARLLLRKGDANPVIEKPSTRFAISEMKGEAQPELTIYCEDRLAVTLIEEAMPYGERIRIKILDVGNNTTVVRQGVCHLRGNSPGRCLCILDGDTTQEQITGWIRSEANGNENVEPETTVLPGDGLPPEHWILEQLAIEDYRNQFARNLGCDRHVAQNHIDTINADLNHHDMVYTLSSLTGFDASDCRRRIAKSIALNHPAFNELRERIAQLLD